MNDVALDFFVHRAAKTRCVSFRRLDAHHDLTVLEGQHICRSRYFHKALVQLSDATIGNKHHAQFAQLTNSLRFRLWQAKATLKRASRELSQTFEIDGLLSLRTSDLNDGHLAHLSEHNAVYRNKATIQVFPRSDFRGQTHILYAP